MRARGTSMRPLGGDAEEVGVPPRSRPPRVQVPPFTGGTAALATTL